MFGVVRIHPILAGKLSLENLREGLQRLGQTHTVDDRDIQKTIGLVSSRADLHSTAVGACVPHRDGSK